MLGWILAAAAAAVVLSGSSGGSKGKGKPKRAKPKRAKVGTLNDFATGQSLEDEAKGGPSGSGSSHDPYEPKPWGACWPTGQYQKGIYAAWDKSMTECFVFWDHSSEGVVEAIIEQELNKILPEDREEMCKEENWHLAQDFLISKIMPKLYPQIYKSELPPVMTQDEIDGITKFEKSPYFVRMAWYRVSSVMRYNICEHHIAT